MRIRKLLKAGIIFLLVTVHSGIVLSQSDLFEEGFVILSSGDTIYATLRIPLPETACTCL